MSKDEYLRLVLVKICRLLFSSIIERSFSRATFVNFTIDSGLGIVVVHVSHICRGLIVCGFLIECKEAIIKAFTLEKSYLNLRSFKFGLFFDSYNANIWSLHKDFLILIEYKISF